MLTVRYYRAPTAAEIEQTKAALVAAGLSFTVRIQKNVKRVRGSISILPRRKRGETLRYFSPEDTQRAAEVLASQGFHIRFLENASVCYRDGFCYLMKEV